MFHNKTHNLDQEFETQVMSQSHLHVKLSRNSHVNFLCEMGVGNGLPRGSYGVYVALTGRLPQPRTSRISHTDPVKCYERATTHSVSRTLLYMAFTQGQIQDFHWGGGGGGTKDYARARTS